MAETKTLEAPVLVPGQIVRVPVEMLQPDPHQPRTEFNQATLIELADDIQERDIELPIVVRSDWTIKDGERRWRAAKIAGLADVPCILATARGAEGEDTINWKLDQVADNHHAEKLGPLDWARFLRQLVEAHGIQVKDIPELLAKRGITMSRSYASNLIRLVELPEWAQELIKTGKLTAAHGKHILTAKDSPAALDAVRIKVEEWLQNEYNGPLTVAEMPDLVIEAFDRVHPDLDEGYGNNAPRFDLAGCEKCPSRKTIAGEDGNEAHFCLDRACFDKKQAEAKASGKDEAGNKPTRPKAKVDPKTAAHKLRQRAEKIAAVRATETIIAQANGNPGLEDLRLIANAVFDWQNMNEIAERRGWDIKKGGNWHSAFHKHVDGANAAELHGLIIEAALHDHNNPLAKVAHRHGIDLKALEKAALEELKKPTEKKVAKKKGAGKAVTA
jgi:ParB/RepB/Spo0J family partition protein